MLETARDLATLEAIIERGEYTFTEVGLALIEIRRGRLYLTGGHKTFETYCRDRWGWGVRRGYQLMAAAEVVDCLSTDVHTPLPVNEAQARELTRLHEPEAIREVWAEVVEEHGPKPPAPKVRAAVKAHPGPKVHRGTGLPQRYTREGLPRQHQPARPRPALAVGAQWIKATYALTEASQLVAEAGGLHTALGPWPRAERDRLIARLEPLVTELQCAIRSLQEGPA